MYTIYYIYCNAMYYMMDYRHELEKEHIILFYLYFFK